MHEVLLALMTSTLFDEEGMVALTSNEKSPVGAKRLGVFSNTPLPFSVVLSEAR
jgi:hypothetical protein